LIGPSQKAAPSAAGQMMAARNESWREPHFSPHLPTPPWEWKILDCGHYYLAKPIPGGLAGFNKDGVFCNSAGQPYDPQPGVVWTVEEYLKQKELYERLDRPYLPGLIKGSPACDSYIAEQRFQEAIGDAKVFSDLLDGRGVSSNRNDDFRKAYSYIVIACDEIGDNRKQALLKLRACVCRYHELDVSHASDLELPEFVQLLKEVSHPPTSPDNS